MVGAVAVHQAIVFPSALVWAMVCPMVVFPPLLGCGSCSPQFPGKLLTNRTWWALSTPSSVVWRLNHRHKQMLSTRDDPWGPEQIDHHPLSKWGLDLEPGDKEGILGELVDRNPIKRKAEPSDISSVVAFLCFSAASYVTGQVIYVDGGFTVSGFPNPSPDHDED
ncbi:hypothetical protein F8388_024962 [Cannabis sativa]|uniref:Uncharacterized protein n=1 Tax=Cannabis sativa TaxID=3483 RepID=A0A7J6G3A6_CANSA|nr:hypothetical protein F8388_024962 [Cannabis sativa]